MNKLWQIVTIASIAILALSACEPKVAERGKQVLAEVAAKIEPNVTTRPEVALMLGAPSAVGQFGDKAWYYVSQRKEGLAFFAPEVVDSNVLRLTFNGDIVETVKNYNQSDSRDISFVGRVTPTEGQEYGFIEQLIGNIGKFNQQQDSVK